MEYHASIRDSVDPVILDRRNQTIIRGDRYTQLSAKAFAVLDQLYHHPRHLLTKNMLLDNVWPDVCVVEAVLKNAIREIRQGLGDNPKSPRFIETVHRRGYRFIGQELLQTTTEIARLLTGKSATALSTTGPSPYVGRAREHSMLDDYWSEAKRGVRRGVVICGDPGVGKSTFIDRWLEQVLAKDKTTVVVQTRCAKTNSRHPYMPLLDLLDRLRKSPHARQVDKLLHQLAQPTTDRRPLPQAATIAAGAKRAGSPGSRSEVLFGAVEFIERLTQWQPLILVLEQYQWCDRATRDLLSNILRRGGAARLLVVVSYGSWGRPTSDDKSVIGTHPDDPEESVRTLHLSLLDRSSVDRYVNESRGSRETAAVVDWLYQQSGGHPLFLRGLVDRYYRQRPESSPDWYHALAEDTTAEKITVALPDAFCERLAAETRPLSAEQTRLLQAASVIMVDGFSSAAVAVLVERETTEIEERCDQLVRDNLWLQRLSARQWPDGTVGQLFGFTHSIYRDYIYQTIPAATKRQFHTLHARRLETAYEGKLGLVAANLAHHFAIGGHRRLAQHYGQLSRHSQQPDTPISVGLAPILHRTSALYSLMQPGQEVDRRAHKPYSRLSNPADQPETG